MTTHHSTPHPIPAPGASRPRLRALKARLRTRVTAARTTLAERIAPRPETPVSDTQVALDVESAQWVKAHQSPVLGAPVPDNTAVIFADHAVQTWMGDTLTTLGWDVSEPVFLTEGCVPARNEHLDTGQPVTTYTTPSKTGAYARKSDPKTSKKAGALAAANQSITVNSHQGQLLYAYQVRHQFNAGAGFTAAEAVNAADLRTDGATGSPWRRVTDLRDMGLITFLLDGTGERVVRKNDSNSDGQVLVITPLGLRAAAALSALRDHGYPDYPLNFDGPTDATLFEELPTTLARIDSMLPLENADA